MNSSCKRINIRHQMISQFYKLLNCIIEHGSLFAKVPDFSRCIRSMRTEHRKKSSHFKPSGIQFAVSLIFNTLVIFSLPEPLWFRICIASAATILPFIGNRKECSYIQCPIRISAQSHIKAFYDLNLKVIPGSTGVTRPEHCCIFLSGSISGTCQIENTHLLCIISLILVNAFRMHQCKCIGYCRIKILFVFSTDKLVSFPWFSLYTAIPVRSGKRFGRITPPGFKALIKEPFFCLFPVHFTCLFIKCIISSIIIKKISCIKEFLMIFASGIHVRPHRNHTVCMHFIYLFHAFFVVTVAFFIKDFFSPVARFPGIPVLNNAVDRNANLSVVTDDLCQFFCCVILLL